MKNEQYLAAAAIEDSHWLFEGRRLVIEAVFNSLLHTTTNSRCLLDIGCGNGGNLPLLSKYGNLFAVELDGSSRERSIQRAIALVENGSLPDNIPFDGKKFDVITGLDVLEHVEDEQKSLSAIRGRLAPDGLLLLTVPAYNFMWTANDEYSHHKRRYTLSKLNALLQHNGFKVSLSSYFNSLLFPFALLYCLLDKFNRSSYRYALKVPPWPFNNFLKAIFFLESLILPKMGFPFGMSIIICAKPDPGWINTKLVTN